MRPGSGACGFGGACEQQRQAVGSPSTCCLAAEQTAAGPLSCRQTASTALTVGLLELAAAPRGALFVILHGSLPAAPPCSLHPVHYRALAGAQLVAPLLLHRGVAQSSRVLTHHRLLLLLLRSRQLVTLRLLLWTHCPLRPQQVGGACSGARCQRQRLRLAAANCVTGRRGRGFADRRSMQRWDCCLLLLAALVPAMQRHKRASCGAACPLQACSPTE